ncbi:MAG: Crp/Fnr family transcriptional regulator [Steroidobacteraceae bacterium]
MNARIRGSDWLLRLLGPCVLEHPSTEGQESSALSRLSSGTRLFRRGEDIIAQGCLHDGIFILVEGFALRYRVLADGRRQVLDIALPGDLMGCPGCFLGAALNTVTALTRGAIAFMTSAELASLMTDSPHLSMAVVRCATGEAARLSEHLVDVGRRSARERVAHFLLEFSTRLVAAGIGTANAFALPVTQVQLSDIVGLSVPHTNRVLKRLCQEELLEMTGRRIQIRNRRALAALGGFDDSYLLSVRRAPKVMSVPAGARETEQARSRDQCNSISRNTTAWL